MNWQDDPEIQREVRERGVRNRIVRSAFIWTPLFLVVGGALVFFFFDMLFGEERGTWFLVVVLTVFASLFGFQSIQSLLDLGGAPRERDGVVTRRWARSDSLVIRSHYVRLEGGTILRGDPQMLDPIHEGDAVRVRYYPHSAVLIRIERIEAPVGGAAGSAPSQGQ